MSFYCEYHGRPLEDVTELQQEECLRNGLTCEECMVFADEVQVDG